MNKGNEERFHELAHKVLAKVAQPAEQSELRALIVENPKLKEEFGQMGAESRAMREILPLLKDIEHPQGKFPPSPMQRLQKAVREVFEPPPEPRGEVREWLARLEKWASSGIGTERDRIMEFISFLRKSPAAGGEPVLAEMALFRTPASRYAARPRLEEEAEARAISEMEEQSKKRDAEFEDRLRSLEARIRRAEQLTHACQEEIQGLLETFIHERKDRQERKRARSTPAEQVSRMGSLGIVPTSMPKVGQLMAQSLRDCGWTVEQVILDKREAICQRQEAVEQFTARSAMGSGSDRK